MALRRRWLPLLPFAIASLGGCAIVSGLNGLALDPACGDSCAADGGSGPPDGSDASAADRATPGDETNDASDSGADGADGGTSAAGEIRCSAGAPCMAGPEECCMSSSSSPTLSCASTSDPQRCPNGTEIKCDGPSDCSGDECCIQLNSSGYILQTVCQSACSGSGWFELCGAGGTCGTGTCNPLAVLPNPPLVPPWFYACQ